MDVITLVLSILAGVGLVSVLGFPVGIIAWLVLYVVFRSVCAALLKHVGS